VDAAVVFHGTKEQLDRRGLAAPVLAEMTERVSYCMYHWDGPGALRHHDHLLALPALDMIQWTPGAGVEPTWHRRWWPYYRKTIEARIAATTDAIEKEPKTLKWKMRPRSAQRGNGTTSSRKSREIPYQRPRHNRSCSLFIDIPPI
jgi:hypothetical protein